MIRPAGFGFNPETAATNGFQHRGPGLDREQIRSRALDEFEGFACELGQRGVGVSVFDDTLDPHKPDAVFPNNWVSFHRSGTAVVYRMLTESRRREVRRELLERLVREHGFEMERTIDWSDSESSPGILEGTGSLALDRVNRIAYACISPRTEEAAVREFGRVLDYETVLFGAVDADALPIYHTNVLMTVGDRFAVICLEAIGDESERETVRERLSSTGHEIVEISTRQMSAFAGNMLQLRNGDGDSLLAASTEAHAALSVEQRNRLESYCDFIVSPLTTIERYGGGSARCMLAEIFLPKALGRG